MKLDAIDEWGSLSLARPSVVVVMVYPWSAYWLIAVGILYREGCIVEELVKGSAQIDVT